jgi:hypothetical protein
MTELQYKIIKKILEDDDALAKAIAFISQASEQEPPASAQASSAQPQ